MKQQQISFDYLFPKLVEVGIYLREDLHTSYWRKGYGGGYRRKGTFIEYLKRLIDKMHAFHSQSFFLSPDYMTAHREYAFSRWHSRDRKSKTLKAKFYDTRM